MCGFSGEGPRGGCRSGEGLGIRWAGGGGEAVFAAALSGFRGHFGEQLYSVTALPFHGLSIGAQTRIARAVPQFDGKDNDMRRVPASPSSDSPMH